MVEFNLDDIKELRRVTELELSGSLDADGVKAFVDALRLKTSFNMRWNVDPLWVKTCFNMCWNVLCSESIPASS